MEMASHIANTTANGLCQNEKPLGYVLMKRKPPVNRSDNRHKFSTDTLSFFDPKRSDVVYVVSPFQMEVPVIPIAVI